VRATNILIVDDIPSFCEELNETLSAAGYSCTICTDPTEATALLGTRTFHLLITTLVMKKLGGFDLIRAIRGVGHSLPWILITGHGSLESAIEAQRLGCSDYLYKPVEARELRARVDKVIGRRERSEEGVPPFQLDKLVSQDPGMKSIFDMVEAIASSNSRVLILGETGTGKQLIAHAIHALSPRCNEPFVEINCAAIPESLLESEFFGHERGAFTGATQQRIGRFEEAQNGTIFLDEIGEIGYSLQAKLLRVLQDGKFNRIGGPQTLRSNARVIAATNRDLRAAAKAGDFRTDLFYRLHVISVTVPPLRSRKKDLPVLTRYFLEKYRPAGRTLELSPEALKALDGYFWPGNVRELEHLAEQICVMHKGPVVHARDLPDYILEPSPEPVEDFPAADRTFREAKVDFERKYLEHALLLHQGNMAQAARFAGMDRSQFFRMVKQHQIDPKK
jgi:DNA-binding NtrC family response regulator